MDANSRTLNAIGSAFQELGIRFATDGDEGVWRVAAQERPATRTPVGRRGGDISTLQRLVYHSRLVPDFGVPDRVDPLPRGYAVPAGISGRLLACDGRVLHVIEGEPDAVRLLFAALATDPRHTAISVITSQPIVERMFPEWRAADDLSTPELGDLRQEPSLIDGFHPERLSPAAALGLLLQVRERASVAAVMAGTTVSQVQTASAY